MKGLTKLTAVLFAVTAALPMMASVDVLILQDTIAFTCNGATPAMYVLLQTMTQ